MVFPNYQPDPQPRQCLRAVLGLSIVNKSVAVLVIALPVNGWTQCLSGRCACGGGWVELSI